MQKRNSTFIDLAMYGISRQTTCKNVINLKRGSGKNKRGMRKILSFATKLVLWLRDMLKREREIDFEGSALHRLLVLKAYTVHCRIACTHNHLQCYQMDVNTTAFLPDPEGKVSLSKRNRLEKHLTALNDLRYLRLINMAVSGNTQEKMGHRFEQLRFQNSDHPAVSDLRKSTSGGIQFLGGDKLVSWSSKKQDCTSILSAQAEFSRRCCSLIPMKSEFKTHSSILNLFKVKSFNVQDIDSNLPPPIKEPPKSNKEILIREIVRLIIKYVQHECTRMSMLVQEHKSLIKESKSRMIQVKAADRGRSSIVRQARRECAAAERRGVIYVKSQQRSHLRTSKITIHKSRSTRAKKQFMGVQRTSREKRHGQCRSIFCEKIGAGKTRGSASRVQDISAFFSANGATTMGRDRWQWKEKSSGHFMRRCGHPAVLRGWGWWERGRSCGQMGPGMVSVGGTSHTVLQPGNYNTWQGLGVGWGVWFVREHFAGLDTLVMCSHYVEVENLKALLLSEQLARYTNCEIICMWYWYTVVEQSERRTKRFLQNVAGFAQGETQTLKGEKCVKMVKRRKALGVRTHRLQALISGWRKRIRVGCGIKLRNAKRESREWEADNAERQSLLGVDCERADQRDAVQRGCASSWNVRSQFIIVEQEVVCFESMIALDRDGSRSESVRQQGGICRNSQPEERQSSDGNLAQEKRPVDRTRSRRPVRGVRKGSLVLRLDCRLTELARAMCNMWEDRNHKLWGAGTHLLCVFGSRWVVMLAWTGRERVWGVTSAEHVGRLADVGGIWSTAVARSRCGGPTCELSPSNYRVEGDYGDYFTSTCSSGNSTLSCGVSGFYSICDFDSCICALSIFTTETVVQVGGIRAKRSESVLHAATAPATIRRDWRCLDPRLHVSYKSEVYDGHRKSFHGSSRRGHELMQLGAGSE
ncbi:hypothetical protein Tco_0363244 [Tanacetum coccineum]